MKESIHPMHIYFDYFEMTVSIRMKVLEGSMNGPGYEEKQKISMEKFNEIADLDKLKQLFSKK